MNTIVNAVEREFRMSETQQKVRYGIGSAAAAAAIFAPLSYKWKAVLTTVAVETILSAVYGISPLERMMHA